MVDFVEYLGGADARQEQVAPRLGDANSGTELSGCPIRSRIPLRSMGAAAPMSKLMRATNFEQPQRL